MEAVSDRHRLRCPSTRAVGGRLGGVARDEIGPGMRHEPAGQHLSFASKDEVNRAMRLQVNKDRRGALTTGEGEISHAERPRRGGVYRFHLAHESQQRIWA